MNNGFWRIIGTMVGSALHRARILTSMQRAWTDGVRASKDRSIARARLAKLQHDASWRSTNLSSMTLSTRAHWLVEAARVAQPTHSSSLFKRSPQCSSLRKKHTHAGWMCASQAFWAVHVSKFVISFKLNIYDAFITVLKYQQVVKFVVKSHFLYI